MVEKSSVPSFYLYRVTGLSEEDDFTYVGQARSAHRVLKHFANSSNRRLKEHLEKASHWPSVECLVLPENCHGDLGIGESAFIAVEKKSAAKAGSASGCLNGRKEAGTIWSDQGGADYPVALTNGSENDGGLWSFPFCRQANEAAIREGVRLMLASKPVGSTFRFLPRPGTPIQRLSIEDLRGRLAEEGIYSAYVVLVNSDVSDDRKPISVSSTDAELAERCLRWWPPSNLRREEVSADPPQAVIAVLGGSEFRIVLGAWRLATGGYNVRSGDCTPAAQDADLCGLQGAVLSGVKFTQASFPIRWIHADRLTWVGH